jgi:MraZ protein
MWGRFEHKLDDKGRVIVPQRLRDSLGEECVLTTGPGNHIRAYPVQVWDTMTAELAGIGLLDEQDKSLNLLQRMAGNCEYASTDPQNRLSIPSFLRRWASLEDGDTAVIVGSGNRLEIWNRANWDSLTSGFTTETVFEASSLIRQSRLSAASADMGLRGNPVPAGA